MGLKDLFLQKGWAGYTLSREETAEHLNGILREHVRLNHAYRDMMERISERGIAQQFGSILRTARMDVGKLSETILSNGGRPYTGTNIEPGDIRLGDSDDAMLFELLDREEALQDRVEKESDVEHQIRTRAILGKVKENSGKRHDALRQLTRRRQRPASTSDTAAANTPVEPTVTPSEPASVEQPDEPKRMTDKPWRTKQENT